MFSLLIQFCLDRTSLLKQQQLTKSVMKILCRIPKICLHYYSTTEKTRMVV